MTAQERQRYACRQLGEPRRCSRCTHCRSRDRDGIAGPSLCRIGRFLVDRFRGTCRLFRRNWHWGVTA